MNMLSEQEEVMYKAFDMVSGDKGYITADDLHKYLPQLMEIGKKYNLWSLIARSNQPKPRNPV